MKKEKPVLKDLVSVKSEHSVLNTDELSQDKQQTDAKNTVDAQSENRRLDAGCAKAVIGWGTVDLRDPRFHFGMWNSRPVNPSAQGALVQSFHRDGENTMRPANALPIIVNREDIDLSTLCTYDEIADKAGPVKFVTADGVVVEIANGQHRFRAHEVYYTIIGTQANAATRHVEYLQSRKDTAADDPELLQAIAHRDERVAYFKTLGSWLGTFYDYGKRLDTTGRKRELIVALALLTPELLAHLSRNKTEPNLGETVEEVLTRSLSTIMVGADLDDAAPAGSPPHQNYTAARVAAILSKEVNGRTDIRKVLYSPSLPLALGSLQRLGPPYSSSWFFKLSSLAALQGVYSGVRILAAIETDTH